VGQGPSWAWFWRYWRTGLQPAALV